MSTRKDGEEELTFTRNRLFEQSEDPTTFKSQLVHNNIQTNHNTIHSETTAVNPNLNIGSKPMLVGDIQRSSEPSHNKHLNSPIQQLSNFDQLTCRFFSNSSIMPILSAHNIQNQVSDPFTTAPQHCAESNMSETKLQQPHGLNESANTRQQQINITCKKEPIVEEILLLSDEDMNHTFATQADITEQVNSGTLPHTKESSAGSMEKNLQNSANQETSMVEEILRHPISCERCRQRHTKCDKILPVCTYCKSNDLQCIYSTPKKLRKNYISESVDLNHLDDGDVNSSLMALPTPIQSSSTTHGHPQSKFKVYKFSLHGKKSRQKKQKINAISGSITSTTASSRVSSGNNSESVTSNPSPTHLEKVDRSHLSSLSVKFSDSDIHMLLKSLRTGIYEYYSCYIAFGTTFISLETIENVFSQNRDNGMPFRMILYPDDVMALLYAIHALNCFTFQKTEISTSSFQRCLELLQYDSSSIENILYSTGLFTGLESSVNLLCLSDSATQVPSMYFTNTNRDESSLFLIGTRLILAQYSLCLGKVEIASFFLSEADLMLGRRFKVYADKSFLPIFIYENGDVRINSLYDGLQPDEISVLRYRLICGVKLDDIRFLIEKGIEYIEFERVVTTFKSYTRTSSVLGDDKKFLFKSFVNRYIFGTYLFITGTVASEILELLSAPIVLSDTSPFSIMSILDFQNTQLERQTLTKFPQTTPESLRLIEQSEVSTHTITEVHDYYKLLGIFRTIFMASYSMLVLHETVLNSTNPLILNPINVTQPSKITPEQIARLENYRNGFADRLSDLFASLPDYTIQYISLLVMAVFVSCKVHIDMLKQFEIKSELQPDSILLRRTKSDLRVLKILHTKFPELFRTKPIKDFLTESEKIAKLFDATTV
ncbi:hypothetical protein C9374_003867 [Naegleria lovaniensis]|uniref:Zn(2)-C6 fungal-type domain-containing protein n=1 Tax=Naegleria lovaniensis TaxID=51637 RepID=A0AA88KQD3_NAELO|nr:uncharacterized protein C9374_003867 [Naegleria lovaniensis]KAG2394103.1 hypothetical protein C9374_003867 [Naegleria lovaniensis]